MNQKDLWREKKRYSVTGLVNTHAWVRTQTHTHIVFWNNEFTVALSSDLVGLDWWTCRDEHAFLTRQSCSSLNQVNFTLSDLFPWSHNIYSRNQPKFLLFISKRKTFQCRYSSGNMTTETKREEWSWEWRTITAVWFRNQINSATRRPTTEFTMTGDVYCVRS